MPNIYSGTIQTDSEILKVRAIFGKDSKINLYKDKELVSSYITKIEKEGDNSKRYHRSIRVYGDVSLCYVILDLFNLSYLPHDFVKQDTSPSLLGKFQIVTEYEKKYTNRKINSRITKMANTVTDIIVIESTDKRCITLKLWVTKNSGRVEDSPNINYSEDIFDISNVVDNAIHAQVRSLQHLKTVFDLGWIDEAVGKKEMRVACTKEDVICLVEEILKSMKETGEHKLYYDTEGTGLKIFNLPPDHPDFDLMAAHVIAWVLERREDGYPLKVNSVAIPVGMKYCTNVDEIWCKEQLKPLLCNPNIGVVSHNSDYEKQINLRYSEIEGELSYNEYYNWKKELEFEIQDVSLGSLDNRIEILEKEKKEIEKAKSSSLMRRAKTASIDEQIKQLQKRKNIQKIIEETRHIPYDKKPYLSKIKGEDIYRVNVKYDTLVLSRMANNGILKRNDLKTLTHHYLKKDQIELDDIFGNSASSAYKIYNFALLPAEYLIYYACPDTFLLPNIEWYLERQAYNNMLALGLNENQAYTANRELLNLYYKVDVPFALHIAEFANYKGIAVDKEVLDMQKAEQEEALGLLLDLLRTSTDEPEINWSSNKQVAPIIFGKFRYPILRYTEQGIPKYDKLVRKIHISQTKDKYESVYETVIPLKNLEEDLVDQSGNIIIKKDIINSLKCPLSYIYQEYMNRYKNLTSFTKMIYERTYKIKDEWIYFPSYKSTSTDTGRASGGIMIMKAAIKHMFGARKGHVLLGGDLDQAELRLASTLSQDLQDIKDFKNPRHDPHTKTASQIHHVPPDKVTKTMRQGAKVYNFGIIYGMQPKSLAENIHPDVVPLPDSFIFQAKLELENYRKANRIKMAWLENIRKATKQLGFSKTPMGRYKWFPEIKEEGIENWKLERVGRQGGNIPIQGLCADYIKERICAVFEVIKNCNVSRYFTQPIFVHDEFHMEIANRGFINAGNHYYTDTEVRETQQFNLLWVHNLIYHIFTEINLGLPYLEDEAPMTLGIGVGENWEQSKSDLHGLPQELQKQLIFEYRNGNIDTNWHANLCLNPIKALLGRIRSWWAEQTVKEVLKVCSSLDEIPTDIDEKIEDLFIKRNLKDIFPLTKEEKDNSLVYLKAIKYATGQEIVLIESKELTSDKIELGDEDDSFEELLEFADIIDFKDLKAKRLSALKKMEDNPYSFENMFKESALMQYGKFMAYDSPEKILEINVNELTVAYMKKLANLLATVNKTDAPYKVVIVDRPRGGTLFQSKTLPCDKKVYVTENLLLSIKELFDLCKKDSLEILKRGIANGRNTDI